MHNRLVIRAVGVVLVGLVLSTTASRLRGQGPGRARPTDALAAVAEVMALRRGPLGDSLRFDACAVYERTGRPGGFPAGIAPGLIPLLDRSGPDPCGEPRPGAGGRTERTVRVDSVKVTDSAASVHLSIRRGEWSYNEDYYFAALPNGRGWGFSEARMTHPFRITPAPTNSLEERRRGDRTATATLLVFASLTMGATLLPAQPPPEEIVVLGAAVTHMVDLLRANDGVPEGMTRYDARVLESRQMAHQAHSTPITMYELRDGRGDAFAAMARNVMNAEAGDFDHARVCATESPRSCTLRDGVAIFATNTPVLCGDSAEVVVKAMWLGDLRKQPVQEGIFLVTLRREPGGWRAVTTRTIRIT